MKTLIIQLARLGDVLQTWPVVSAVRRAHPETEIHFLTRRRFAEAAEGLSGWVVHHVLDTEDVLGPAIGMSPELERCRARFDIFVERLRAERFERIVNLSFSPFSSYLVDLIAEPGAEISGYTRFADGYLAIPDDTSAYFHAQVGVGRANRAHLSEIMAAIASVDLDIGDWAVPGPYLERVASSSVIGEARLGDRDFIVIQVGASQAHKSLGAHKWLRVVSRLMRQTDLTVVLAGSANERPLAEEVAAGFPADRVVNLVGRTAIKDVVALVLRARLVIGGDSLLMQVANVTRTPCLNLSFATVNFWETGPRVPGSRILWAPTVDDLPSDRVVAEALASLQGRESGQDVILVHGFEPERIEIKGFQPDDFPWRLIQAVYMGQPFPENFDRITALGFERLNEICHMALDYIPHVADPARRSLAIQVLEQVDVMIPQIEKMAPRLRPVTAWFQTERLRLGPMDVDQLIVKNQELFGKLERISALYVPAVPRTEMGVNHGNENRDHKI